MSEWNTQDALGHSSSAMRNKRVLGIFPLASVSSSLKNTGHACKLDRVNNVSLHLAGSHCWSTHICTHADTHKHTLGSYGWAPLLVIAHWFHKESEVERCRQTGDVDVEDQQA